MHNRCLRGYCRVFLLEYYLNFVCFLTLIIVFVYFYSFITNLCIHIIVVLSHRINNIKMKQQQYEYIVLFYFFHYNHVI